MTSSSTGPTPDAIYAAVAARRTSFDNLVWQVPALSLTAQAFLFSIELGAGSSRFARTIAAVLSMIASFLTVQIFTRHRQAEIVDAHWLRDLEEATGVAGVHGPEWAARRHAEPADAWFFSRLARLPGYRTWAVGLSLFGLAGFVVLFVTWTMPEWLT